MNTYSIKLKTSFNFGEPTYVDHLLRSWCEYPDKTLRPERFNIGEPVRRNIQEEGVDAVIQMWLDKQMSVMLKRVSKPKFEVGINWRPEIGLDARPYPFGCTVWLALSAGDEKAITLFKWLIQMFKPAFGLISTYDDIKEKHFVQVKSHIGTVEKYMGLDVQDTMPGIYWCTYFGAEILNRVGDLATQPANAFEKTELEKGIFLRMFKSSSAIGSPEASMAIEGICQKIGKKKFFNLAQAREQVAAEYR